MLQHNGYETTFLVEYILMFLRVLSTMLNVYNYYSGVTIDLLSWLLNTFAMLQGSNLRIVLFI